MAQIKRILIFEPWNLGDLIIAVSFARRLYENHGVQSFVICNSNWIDWVESFEFVLDIKKYDAPWTKKVEKYNPMKYSIKDIYNLREWLKDIKPDLLWDVRGDIRHRIFLSIISYNNKIISIRYPKNANVYQRIDSFLEKMRLNNNNKYINKGIHLLGAKNKIAVFIDSYWKNKRVPPQIAENLLSLLLRKGYTVNLIIPPNLKYPFEATLGCQYPQLFNPIRGTISFIEKVIMCSTFVISTDSAWLHMAHFHAVPSVGLFGSDNYIEWAPPGTEIFLSDTFIPQKERYRLKNENKTPLVSLNVESIIEYIHGYIYG